MEKLQIVVTVGVLSLLVLVPNSLTVFDARQALKSQLKPLEQKENNIHRHSKAIIYGENDTMSSGGNGTSFAFNSSNAASSAASNAVTNDTSYASNTIGNAISNVIRNTTTIPPSQANGLRHDNAPSMIVIVLSARNNFDERQAIRETWAEGHDVLFILGNECPYPPSQRIDDIRCMEHPNISTTVTAAEEAAYTAGLKAEEQKLRLEQRQFNDTFITEAPDSYRSLPHKLKEGYAQALQRSVDTRWIFKADDDSFVRVGTVAKYVASIDSDEPTILGRIRGLVGVGKVGKNAEFDYNHTTYPLFPLGSCGHVVNRPMATFIAENRNDLFEYQGEDVSLGIWANESGLPVRMYTSTRFDLKPRKCSVGFIYSIGHRVSPDRMRECYRTMDESVVPLEISIKRVQ